MVDPFQDVKDEQDAQNVELSENVARDYVEYHRGNVVGHEEEGLLMYFATLTGWAYDDGVHNNVIGQGPPGSGKSLTKNTVEALFDGKDTYTKTSASGNAILDSVDWDISLIAPMDEYDKIDRPIIEVLKSSNPEDGGYSKDRNVEDPDAHGGYKPVEVSAEANPWILLYAPSSKKGGIDDELEDRALVLYFSNSKHTRRGIGRKEFGHEDIDLSSDEHSEEFIYDVHDLAARLREHHRDLPTESHYEEDDDGDEYLAARSGDLPTYVPPWVWYACEPVFNVDEDYTNRVYGIVSNEIQGSAIANHEHRNRKEIEVYVDEDSTLTETREAVVVAPQDVANVLSCLPTLLSTTHQLTPLKRHILDAVDATEPMTDADGTTVSKVQEWLDDNDIPHPSRSTLKNRLDELSEDYYLQAWEASAGPKGQATAYERHDEGALQPPNIYDLQRHADRDGITLAQEDCVDIDPSEPFVDAEDPIRDQPFEQTVSEFREQFSGEDVGEESYDAADFMGPEGSGNNVSDDEDESSSGGQASLTDVSSDGVEASESDDSTDESVELDPSGSPDTPTEKWLLDAMQDADGDVFGSQHDVTHYAGVVDHDKHSTDVDLAGTVVDPDHELWQGRPDLRDDRVVTEADALRELNEGFGELKQKGLVVEDESGGPTKMHKLRVADEV